MNELSITAIVVLYYSKHLLNPLLANITEKIIGLDEIILVDNSNEDLSDFENPLVKVIHPPKNIGYGAAINLGVSMAKNENIVAMNPDLKIESFDFCFATPPATEYILSGIPNGASEFTCFPTPFFDLYRLGFFNLAKLFKPLRKIFRKTPCQHGEDYTPVDWIPGLLIITNKKTLSQIDGFDEKYFLFYEEVDLCKRAHDKGIYVGVSNTIQIKNFCGTSSINDVSDIKIRSEIDSFKRYHSKYSPYATTFLAKTILKIWSLLIKVTCAVVMQVSKREKVRNKMKQYALYASNL